MIIWIIYKINNKRHKLYMIFVLKYVTFLFQPTINQVVAFFKPPEHVHLAQ